MHQVGTSSLLIYMMHGHTYTKFWSFKFHLLLGLFAWGFEPRILQDTSAGLDFYTSINITFTAYSNLEYWRQYFLLQFWYRSKILSLSSVLKAFWYVESHLPYLKDATPQRVVILNRPIHHSDNPQYEYNSSITICPIRKPEQD